MSTAALVERLLAFVWLPLLIAAGALDWACHRRLRIEHTAGLPESLLHLLMLLLLGSALLGGLLLQTTAGLLVTVFVLLLLHEATYAADLRVALAARQIPALEQWVHGFQHLLPWCGWAGLLALAPQQALALLGRSDEAADWALRLKQPLPPWPYTAAVLLAALVLNVLPFLSEARRSARAAARAQ
ncbi:MAG: diguanylate cyclase [Rubrivivax sp.]|nr:MAG: diguanylate cyclase [Rubrivivax sp.]